MIVSINTEKSFDRIQYIFMIKKGENPLSKLRIEKEFLP